MDLIELQLHTEPGQLLAGDTLVDLLRQWIVRTGRGDELIDLRALPGRDEALARLRYERRTLEVQLHHEGGPQSHRLWLQAWTWVMPPPSRTRVPVVAGVALTAALLVLTFAWLSDMFAAVIVGVFVAFGAGRLLTLALYRGDARRRTAAATRDAGGQAPAQDLLAELDAVVRTDPRVVDVRER